MITSLVLTLSTAAITGCGGGGGAGSDDVTQAGVTATTVAPVTVASSISASASAVATAIAASTDAATVAAITTVVGASTSSVTDAPTTSDASTSTVVVGASAQTAVSESGTATASTNSALSASTLLASAISTAIARLPVSTGTRPTGNTGSGFYVSGSKLYDAKGKEFRIRGVNRNHWDSYGSPTGLPRSGANTERIALDFTQPTTSNWNIVSSQMLANKIVPIPGNWNATCSSDPAALSAIVDTWVAQASTWTQLNSKGLINIANEWGPPNSTVWRDSYISAISRLRAAGYTGTLVVDSGGCGQDPADLVQYGAAVLASDPQKNILFDLHVYGNFVLPATVSWQTDYTKSMTSLKASGLPMITGEFGPGRNIGASPTLITPQQVIATAESNGWGWMGWAWDDVDLPNCMADNNWYSMTLNCGTYNTDADLTTYGKIIVSILKATAVKATIFN